MSTARIFRDVAGMVLAIHETRAHHSPEQHDRHVRRWKWLAFERARAEYEEKYEDSAARERRMTREFYERHPI